MTRRPNGNSSPPPTPMKNILLILSAALLASCSTLSSGGRDPLSNADIPPARALELLKEGNARYVQGRHAGGQDAAHRRSLLTKGQYPFAVILGCADSRTAPEILFDQSLGDLFVCRVAGNVTDPVVLGSIEYAVEHLKCPLVVVLGHTGCGAVKAAVGGGHAEGNIAALIGHVHAGSQLPADPTAKVDAGVANNARHQKVSLTSRSAVIRKLVDAGKVQVASGVYSLETGEVTWQ